MKSSLSIGFEPMLKVLLTNLSALLSDFGIRLVSLANTLNHLSYDIEKFIGDL